MNRLNKFGFEKKNSVLVPNCITIKYLNFALISIETEFPDNFQTTL